MPYRPVCLGLAALLLQVVSAPIQGGYPIRSLDSTDFSDLQFLKPVVAGARIVQLGENGHGTAEAMALRARIARFLHAELNFTVLAFESSLFLCHLGDAMAAEAEPRRTLLGSVIGVWHTEEVLPLFTYVKDTRSGKTPLRLSGFDVQPIGTNRKRRPAFLQKVVAGVDQTYAAEVLAIDSGFNAEYDKGSASRRTYFRSNGKALAAAYEKLAGFLDREMPALRKIFGREVPLIARQEARSMAAYVRYQAATDMRAYAETRDRAMAENVIFLAEELFPGQKVIVWGHNYHLRHDNAAIPPREEIFPGVAARSMGSWLREKYGDRLYTIGQYEGEGRALDNSRQPYVVEPPAEGSLERRLTIGPPLLFVDVRSSLRSPSGAWLKEPVTTRYNGQHTQTIVATNQYDGLLMISRVSPPKFLY